MSFRPQASTMLLSIDGKNWATRAAAWAQRQTPTVIDTLPSALHRLLQALFGVLNTYRPTGLFIAWDHGRSAHRRDLYPPYKANHDEKTPAQLTLAALTERLIALVQQCQHTLPFYQAQTTDCEADDLIALTTRTLAVRHVLYSTDGDYLQLLGPRVELYNPQTQQHVTKDTLARETGLTPEQWLDYKILVGDQGDNVPGIHGLGPKTAKQLLQHFGTIESMLVRREEAVQLTRRARILLDPTTDTIIARNRALMTLHVLPDEASLRGHLPFVSAHTSPTFDRERWRELLRDLRAQRLLHTEASWLPLLEHLATTSPSLPPPPLI